MVDDDDTGAQTAGGVIAEAEGGLGRPHRAAGGEAQFFDGVGDLDAELPVARDDQDAVRAGRGRARAVGCHMWTIGAQRRIGLLCRAPKG